MQMSHVVTDDPGFERGGRRDVAIYGWLLEIQSGGMYKV